MHSHFHHSLAVAASQAKSEASLDSAAADRRVRAKAGAPSGLGKSVARSPVGGRGCRGVNEDVVFGQLLDVLLNLVHLLLQGLLAVLLAKGVELLVVTLSLEVLVEGLPLLLQSSDELLSLLLGHEELLAVSLILLLDLHFANKVVLVLNLILDLCHVGRGLSVVSLLQEVLVLAHGEFGSYKARKK